MTDYYSLIARAVEGLDTSTGEARWVVYERARKAVEQLGSNQPALLEADITKERLALEGAILFSDCPGFSDFPELFGRGHLGDRGFLFALVLPPAFFLSPSD